MIEFIQLCSGRLWLIFLCLGLSGLVHLGILLFPFPASHPQMSEEIFITLEAARKTAKTATLPPMQEKPEPIPVQPAVTPALGKAAKNTPRKAQPSSKQATKIPESRASTKSAPVMEAIPPRLRLGNKLPEYPPLARKRGQEGVVLVRCLIDVNGNAVEAAIKTGSGFRLLDEGALKAVKSWKFQPASKNGQPVAEFIVVPVEFRLN